MAAGEESEGRGYVDAYVYLALMVLIGSSTATAAKLAIRELPFGLLPLVRFGGAGLCLLPMACKGGALWRTIRESPGRLLAAAALCVPINQSFFLTATKLAPTTHVGLIYGSVPLVVLALAVALGQERLDGNRLVGILASVSGVVVVGLGNLWAWEAEGADALRGDLLLIGAVVSWGAYLTVSKPLVARHGAIPALAGTFLVGTLLFLPIGLATMPGWRLQAASATAWESLAYITLVVSIVGLGCQNAALRRLDASQVAAVGNAAPVLTVVWGVWLLGEAARPALALGGALTLGGIYWITRPIATPTKIEPVAQPGEP
ncbi:MAG TPA: DMT family transporter [Isosphaeraceae bacterium]|jgi:drug/metabolite transporter (DMT)-like permease|nr:DMT family transporter [Isosphaeraceae bacterium]